MHTHILSSTQTNGKSPLTNKFKLQKIVSLSIKRGILYKSKVLSWTSLLLLSLNSCFVGVLHIALSTVSEMHITSKQSRVSPLWEQSVRGIYAGLYLGRALH